VRAQDIPIAKVDDGRVIVKVIAGESHGVVSQHDLAYTPIWYLDLTILPGGHVQQAVPQGWNVFAYTLRGHVSFHPSTATSGKSKLTDRFHVVVFEQTGDFIKASVPDTADEQARFILFAGKPLDQKIVQYGPFVLSSEEEVYKAMADFRMGKNGFERALTWKSDLQRRLDYP
jgi:hypothetical protein